MAPSSLFLKAAAFAVVGLSSRVSALLGPYQLVDNYQGTPGSDDSFFDLWSFNSANDPTHGYVDYQTSSAALGSGLAYVNNFGQAYLGVDDTTDLTGSNARGRASVRIESNNRYDGGLFIADIAHMPGSICGVWPAFWTVNQVNYPDGGEIDIIEGINQDTVNTETLHTNDGCSIVRGDQGGTLQGAGNCNNAYSQPPLQYPNQGCGVSDTSSSASYGDYFNEAGGGVYAMEWTDATIKIWNFPSGSIPLDITTGNPDPSGWGPPTLAAGGPSCSVSSHFYQHQIIFDNTFCGDFAGQDVFWQQTTCYSAAQFPTCQSYVESQAGAFADAYWLINSVKVYQRNNNPASTSTSSTTSTTSTTSSTTTSTTSSTTSTTSTTSSTTSSSTTSTTSSTTSSTSSSTVSSTTSSTALSTSSSTISSTTSSTTSSTSSSAISGSASSTTSGTTSGVSSGTTSSTTSSTSSSAPSGSASSTTSSTASGASSSTISSLTSGTTSAATSSTTQSTTSSVPSGSASSNSATTRSTGTSITTGTSPSSPNSMSSSSTSSSSVFYFSNSTRPASPSTSSTTSRTTPGAGLPTTSPGGIFVLLPSTTASIAPTGTVQMTTSTAFTTVTSTITQCPATVKNCPAGYSTVVTSTIALYTTVCPVTPVPTNPLPAPQLTTSTVYTTAVMTITQCPPSVTSCPASLIKTVTSTFALYTTVCPASAAPIATNVMAASSPAAVIVIPVTVVPVFSAPAVKAPAATSAPVVGVPPASVLFPQGNSTKPASSGTGAIRPTAVVGTSMAGKSVNEGSIIALIMVVAAGLLML